MSAMHHDTSSDLKVVADKLRDILGVFLIFLPRRVLGQTICLFS